jgi:molybdate transport system regulatory protein
MSGPNPTLSLRIDLVNGERLGPGKIALLDAIAEAGSITAAAKTLGMSYPRAWKLVENMNASFKTPLVDTFQGGPKRGGAGLTDAGHEVRRLYALILTEAEKSTETPRTRLASLQAKMSPDPTKLTS